MNTKSNSKGLAEVNGKVILILPNAFYRVKLDDADTIVLCYLGGKMTKNFIKPCLGDRVKLEMSPTDSTKGRIVYLYRN